jgi:hypothetical protein
VRSVAMGLLLEEHRGEITSTWKKLVETELGGEAAIGYAVAPLLREMALALRGDVSQVRARVSAGAGDGASRCAVLVRSTAQPARVAREFKLVHRAIWDVLRREAQVVAPDERRAADEWLDDALAAALERLERVRLRIEVLERGSVVVPAARGATSSAAETASLRPPPLPRNRPATLHPPPLPGVTRH